jgi:hypothetical protein
LPPRLNTLPERAFSGTLLAESVGLLGKDAARDLTKS